MLPMGETGQNVCDISIISSNCKVNLQLSQQKFQKKTPPEHIYRKVTRLMTLESGVWEVGIGGGVTFNFYFTCL